MPDKEPNVIGPKFGDEPNASGALYELATRKDIKGFIIIFRREDGLFEHFRTGMDMGDQGYACAIAQENLISRIQKSR